MDDLEIPEWQLATYVRNIDGLWNGSLKGEIFFLLSKNLKSKIKAIIRLRYRSLTTTSWPFGPLEIGLWPAAGPLDLISIVPGLLSSITLCVNLVAQHKMDESTFNRLWKFFFQGQNKTYEEAVSNLRIFDFLQVSIIQVRASIKKEQSRIKSPLSFFAVSGRRINIKLSFPFVTVIAVMSSKVRRCFFLQSLASRRYRAAPVSTR